MTIDGPNGHTSEPIGDALDAGSTVGPYAIVSLIGRGGMGEVYRATDTRLHRDVALKVLARARSDAPGSVDRFMHEARLTASLDHSNVVKVYDVGIVGDRPYLVGELLQGETLRERIDRGALPVADVQRIATEIARGLVAAHAAGLVHRDLKPENVFLTRAGVTKVLDFGIAKLARPDAPDMVATATGVVLGTPAYLAPEQIRGDAVDSRTDLFALGVVMYEMLTGERPFAREHAVEALSAVLNEPPPDLVARRSDVPPVLRTIVARLLEKDPADRFHSAADLVWALEQIGRGQILDDARHPKRPARRALVWIAYAAVAGVVVALAAAGAALWQRPAPQVDVFSVLLPDNATLTEGEAPQVSPDGRTLALVGTDASGKTFLYVRERGSLGARALPETDDAALPFWSPDSRSLAFFARGMLKRIDVAGGRAQPLARAPVPRGGAWNQDDTIIFVPFPEQPLQALRAEDGTAVPLPAGSDRMRWFPSFLPDGRHYLYLAWPDRIVRVGSLDSPVTKDVLKSHSPAVYVEPGWLLYRRNESLVAQRFDRPALEVQGTPLTLADRIRMNPITTQSSFSASGNGVIAYVGAGHGWQLAWFDPEGKRLGTAGVIGGHNSLCLSADGKRVVFDATDSRGEEVDIWTLDIADGSLARLTFDPATDFYAVCSPSTDEIVFASPRGGTPALFRLDLSAPGSERRLADTSEPRLATQWSADNRVVYSAFSTATNWDIWTLPLAGGPPSAFLATEAEERNGQLSPDGRWMAYASDLGGTFEVYVQPFPATSARWQISRGGGRQPLWSPDGKRLYYISLDNKLVAVDVDGNGTRFEPRAPRVVIDTRVGGWERTHQGTPYAVSADSKRILIANAQDTTTPVTIVLNWESLAQAAQR